MPNVSVQVVPTIQVLEVSEVSEVGVNVPVHVTPSLATEIEPIVPLAQAMSAAAKPVAASERTTVTVAVSPSMRVESSMVTLVVVGATVSTW